MRVTENTIFNEINLKTREGLGESLLAAAREGIRLFEEARDSGKLGDNHCGTIRIKIKYDDTFVEFNIAEKDYLTEEGMLIRYEREQEDIIEELGSEGIFEGKRLN